MITWLCVPRCIPLRTGRCRGVTVVELVTLVALLMVLAALAIPTISPIVLRYRVRGAAWQVAGDLRLARQRAVTLKKRFKFCVTDCSVSVPPGSYSVEREDVVNSGTWVNEQGVATRLPPDVTITVNAVPTFTLTGTAASGTVTLSNLLSVYKVAVAQSGRVQVCEGACPP
jgi:type II secretory pathway pseudopilin PulG